jgi:hypothetical protein
LPVLFWIGYNQEFATSKRSDWHWEVVQR